MAAPQIFIIFQTAEAAFSKFRKGKHKMSKKTSDNEYFWNRRSRVYDDQVWKVYKKAYKKTVKRTLPYLNQEAKVLDFGCGTGNTTITISQNVREIVAIDTSEEMMEKAVQKAAGEGCRNITFCHTDLMNFSGEPERFCLLYTSPSPRD